MRRLRTLTAAVAVVALIAAGCGDDDGDDDGNGVEPGSLQGQSVTVNAVWSGDEQASFEAVLDAFEAETGASVNFTSTGEDIAAVLGPAIEAGSPPDVALLPQPGLLADLAGQGALVEIEDIAGSTVDEHYASVWRELGSVDGTLYGVWFKAANKSTVWYNIGAFEDAGVEPPETWDDLLAVSQTVADSGVTPWSIGVDVGWPLTDWFENVYLRTAGAEAYDQLTNHEIPWTDESVVEALEVLADIFGEESWIAGGTSGALQTDFPGSVAQVYSDPPEAAMVYEGDFVAGVITDETEAELGTDADFFDFPSIDGSAPAVVGGGDVAVLLTDNEAAAELIRWLATPAAGEVWAERGGFTSPNQDVDLDTYPDDITRASAEALTEAETFRFDMSDLQPAAFGSTVGAGMFQLFQDFFRDPADIEGVTQALEQEAAAAHGS